MTKTQLRSILASEGLIPRTAAGTSWTQEEFNAEVERTFKSTKSQGGAGYTKAQAKKDVLQMIKDEKITLTKKAMDHGYESAIAGGTDVMQTLVKDLREEQLAGGSKKTAARTTLQDWLTHYFSKVKLLESVLFPGSLQNIVTTLQKYQLFRQQDGWTRSTQTFQAWKDPDGRPVQGSDFERITQKLSVLEKEANQRYREILLTVKAQEKSHQESWARGPIEFDIEPRDISQWVKSLQLLQQSLQDLVGDLRAAS